VTTFQAQTSQLGADCVAATSDTTRDLCCALPHSPELFEECQIFRIPAHGRYYTPTVTYRPVVFRLPRATAPGCVRCSLRYGFRQGPTGGIPYFGRPARQHRWANFLQPLAGSFPPATLALRFLTLAVTAAAHQHGANSLSELGGDHAWHEGTHSIDARCDCLFLSFGGEVAPAIARPTMNAQGDS
jgi:hypothetical protein